LVHPEEGPNEREAALSHPEVASYLNVSRSKVYELLKSGELRSVHIDRTRLVRSCVLLAYVDSLAAAS
jgi:excisionase family DNA binding protein